MMNTKIAAAIFISLLSSASANGSNPEEFFNKLQAHKEHIVPMPMHVYADECGAPANLRVKPEAAALLQQDNVPGAGIDDMDKFKPFKTVLKDGFLLVDCVRDYMYERGDKFGDNKHDYKLGPVSGVSIVHYDAFVAKEDRAEMTQKKCFEFCRTVPNMGFFGIVNGRGCYCTPYFSAMASDSSQCDAVCEGDNTMMCGGKSKSSIFAMHMCDSTEDDLGLATDKASDLKSSLDEKTKEAKGLAGALQSFGEGAQKTFGAVGDSQATGVAQNAKVMAGKLEAAAKAVGKVSDELGTLSKTKLKDFTDAATVTKAERTMEDIDQASAEGEAAADKLDKLLDLAQHDEVKGAVKQYYPVMYFVDKEFEDVPQTCSGDVVAEPLVGSEDACAAACDSNIHSCVGFQFFEAGKSGVCQLFSNFKTGFYYTGCGKKGGPSKATCFAKLSKFEGTTLKPDGSGKCKQCFNELTKADRCF